MGSALDTEADPGSVKRGGGRESKFLDAAPENNKNRPKKQKSAEKRGGPRPIRPPPPLDPPLRHAIYFIHFYPQLVGWGM